MHTSSDAMPVGSSAGPTGALATFDRYLGKAVEFVAGTLVLLEIIVLFTGVVARYLFHSPLIWSDEVATIGFLWLTMLGAVVALRRGQHMRMTALVSHLPPDRRAFLEALATGVSLAFLLLIMAPAWEYAMEEAIVITPALEISVLWRAISIPIGITLMLITALLRLALIAPRTRMTVAGLLAIALVVALFSVAGPVLIPLGKLNLVIFFVVIVAAGVFSGVPIAFSLGLT